MDTIVVTRHSALISYLKEIGLIGGDATVLSHASADDVRGKHVVGVLPLRLAACAASVTEVPLNIPQDRRGEELSLEEIRHFAGHPARYVVRAE